MRSATRWRMVPVRCAYTLAVVAMLLWPSPRETSYRSAPASMKASRRRASDRGSAGVATAVGPQAADPARHLDG